MSKEKDKKSCDLKNCSRHLFKFVQVEMNVLQDCTSKAMKSRDHLQSNIFIRGFRKPQGKRTRWYIFLAAAVLIISLAVVAITLAIYFGTGEKGELNAFCYLYIKQYWSNHCHLIIKYLCSYAFCVFFFLK